MDALALDQMLPEYQEKREEAARELSAYGEEEKPPPPPIPPKEDLYETEVGSGETIPVADEVDSLQAYSGAAGGVSNQPIMSRGSKGSTSSGSSVQEISSSRGSSSFYNASSMSPVINYERDFPAQKLVAVFGRQFDRPEQIANSFQKLVASRTETHEVKFVPFTLKRKALLKGSYDSEELRKHDLVCMCYNASEARILLTGTDGFYTSLLRHTEGFLGPNKVAFLITNYSWPVDNPDTDLISPTLRRRLYSQEPLRVYLDREQVLSWVDSPSKVQATKLVELAQLENNPQNNLLNQACIIL